MQKQKKIIGILGPTNTGKTFTAMGMLFSHKNEVIGFPFRLLARENYEIAKKEKGSMPSLEKGLKKINLRNIC